MSTKAGGNDGVRMATRLFREARLNRYVLGIARGQSRKIFVLYTQRDTHETLLTRGI